MRTSGFLGCVLLAGSLIVGGGDLCAQKGEKGGKGGKGNPPPGIIYFTWDGLTRTMDGAGAWPDADANGEPDPVGPAEVAGSPSHGLHGALEDRWFLKVIPRNSPDPDAGKVVALSESGPPHMVVAAPPAADWKIGGAQWGKPLGQDVDHFISYSEKRDNSTEFAFWKINVTWNAGTPSFDTANKTLVLSPVDTGGVVPGGHNWAPSGDEFVFDMGGSLWIMDITGNPPDPNPRFLTPNGYGAVWSPVADLIAFVGPPSAIHTIMRINADGTGLKQLARGHGGWPGKFVAAPSWSRDGTHLLYARGPGSIRFGYVDPIDIFRMTADGGSKTNLTKDLYTDQFNFAAYARGWR